MRLRKFRARAYRCIHDSGEIRVGDLAAFVGRNESGKTTILQALTLLNKDQQVSELDLCDEMIDDLKEEVRLAEGEFELNFEEIKLIKETFPSIPEIRKIKIFRTNKNPIPQYDFGDVEISEAENSGLNSWENFREKFLLFLDTIPNHVQIKLDTEFFQGQAPETDMGMDDTSMDMDAGLDDIEGDIEVAPEMDDFEGADAASAETDDGGREMKEDAYLQALSMVKEAQADGKVNKEILKQAFAVLKK